MNIGDWRVFTSTLDNGYANWHMRPLWIYANKLIFELKQDNPLDGVQKKQ